MKINACFAVKAWRSNDGFLGDGSFQAGIRATELRPGKDVGTSIVTGATPERFEIVKWFYIEADDDTGYDAATDVITRALAYLDHRTPIAELDAGPATSSARDLLADLVAVLGDAAGARRRCARPAAGPGARPRAVSRADRGQAARDLGTRVRDQGGLDRQPLPGRPAQDPRLHRPARGRRPRR